MDSITSLFIVYRYDSTTGTFTVPLVEMDSIISLFIVYRYDSTTGTFTVSPSGDRLFLCLLFTDMTTQPEHSQCPLVETDSITALFIVYRYDSTTGTFTVPPSGDGFYYFSAYFRVVHEEYAGFDIQINGAMICTAYTDNEEVFDQGQAACSGATYATEGW